MILYDDEPLEVCILKKHLANLTCKCSVCDKPDISGSCAAASKGSKEIQAGNVLSPLEQSFKHDNTLNPNFEILCNSVSCPGCYIALNLLKAKETKVWKDEETETMLGLSCCDKSSGKCVKFLERTTSTSSINPTKNSCTNLYEKVTNTTALNGIMKKRSNEHVTFSDLDHDRAKRDVQAFYGHCFCLQNFIDSIRPPLPSP